ncbi:MAG: WD40/YVTN/BNR-like repeat-containing protein, partial [Candidatus Acidiferrales bacterium]
MLAVTGVSSQTNVYYFGSVSGGVWKTTNGGLTWVPVFDKEPIASIGAIAAAPSDPNVIYVGTGESCIRGDISYGNGVYKSVDAGRTWTHVGLEDTRHIGRVIIDPQNPEIVFVAALGHAFGPNSERGVFRSEDGGKTWQKVL